MVRSGRGRATNCSLAPCGGGMGRGVFAGGSNFTPLPSPPPQGGRELALSRGSAQNHIIANRDVSWIPCRPAHHHQLEAVGVLDEIVQMENANALSRANIAAREP